MLSLVLKYYLLAYFFANCNSEHMWLKFVIILSSDLYTMKTSVLFQLKSKPIRVKGVEYFEVYKWFSMHLSLNFHSLFFSKRDQERGAFAHSNSHNGISLWAVLPEFSHWILLWMLLKIRMCLYSNINAVFKSKQLERFFFYKIVIQQKMPTYKT